MPGPLEPAGLNFLGLSSGGPNVVTGTVPPDPAQVENEAQPVAATADLVEISPEAQNAARAVRPTQDAVGNPVPRPRGEETAVNPAQRERSAAKEQALVNAESAKTPVANVRNLGVRFRINNDVRLNQVSIVDRKTQEVVREVPPEKRIRIAEHLQATLQDIQSTGLTIDQEA